MDHPENTHPRLTASIAYRRPDQDLEFLTKDELRAVRLQLDWLKPEILQQAEGIASTIVVFGSARLPEPETARTNLTDAEEALTQAPTNPKQLQNLTIARHQLHLSRYYDEAREFGRLVSSTCQIDGQCDYVIVTGGGPGIMEAGNRGAHDAGAKSIGLNISIPYEQTPNPYITPSLCFQFHYFAIRKMHFLNRAKALVAFPGGFGTLDELFETLTLLQTKVIAGITIVLMGKEFWEKLINWKVLVDSGLISPNDLALFHYAETAQEAWDLILKDHPEIPIHPQPPHSRK